MQVDILSCTKVPNTNTVTGRVDIEDGHFDYDYHTDTEVLVVTIEGSLCEVTLPQEYTNFLLASVLEEMSVL